MEMEDRKKKIKWITPRRLIVIARLPRREFAKIRKWLDEKDQVDIGTAEGNRLLLLNTTKIQKHKTQAHD
jgi:hypothetical protein